MKQVAWITDPLFLQHRTGEGHPESPRRLEAVTAAVAPLLEFLTEVAPQPVPEALLSDIHAPTQIAQVKRCSATGGMIDADTLCSTHSYRAALKAAGAGVTAVDGIVNGRFERAFCAVRPPGHHATSNKSMGFCLFNNIAVTAKYALRKGYRRVMIVDFDVHHGNGTQEIFWEEEAVFYFSSHQAFAYPGTGMEDERGEGRGKGKTRNFLLMPDSGDRELIDIYENELPPCLHAFDPDLLLVSAGYDLHESDPLAQLQVTTEGIRSIVRAILAAKQIPAVFFLEGGYDVDALGKNVRVTVEEMLKA